MKSTIEPISIYKKLFDYFNKALFSSTLLNTKLPEVIFIFSKKPKGFTPNNWKDAQGEFQHEISINPNFNNNNKKEICKYLVLQMVKLYHYTYDNKTYSMDGYSNESFAKHALEFGLQCSKTGKTGGKPIGYAMNAYIIENGLFEKLYKKAPVIKDPLTIANPNKPTSQRTKYTCKCGFNVWGKSELSIKCTKCKTLYKPNV